MEWIADPAAGSWLRERLALCADERIEALPIPAGAGLTWDSDEVNR